MQGARQRKATMARRLWLGRRAKASGSSPLSKARKNQKPPEPQPGAFLLVLRGYFGGLARLGVAVAADQDCCRDRAAETDPCADLHGEGEPVDERLRRRTAVRSRTVRDD